jgi:hypothetical protein
MLVLRRKARLCENALKAALISRALGQRWVAYGDVGQLAGWTACSRFLQWQLSVGDANSKEVAPGTALWNVPVADRVPGIVRAPEGEQGITSGALCAARNFSRSPRLPQRYSKGASLIVLFQQQVQIYLTGRRFALKF